MNKEKALKKSRLRIPRRYVYGKGVLEDED